MRLALIASFSVPLLLTGCALTNTTTPSLESGPGLRGSVHGGQQPINGAKVYLLAANVTGYGQPSVSLLNPASTGQSDSIGGYVTTGADGSFTITGDYSCTSAQQVYLYALGGDAGAGANSASGLLAILGACPASGNFLASVPVIQVNEVTTVAAAYALSGFATNATHVSSPGTPLAQIGIANAFTNAANLADISTGYALTTTPAGNGAVPQTTINTLANILASCINSTTASGNCNYLFLNTSSGGNPPSDTASAAINIAHKPSAQIAALYSLAASSPPFAPSLTIQPSDFTLALHFTGPTIAPSGYSGTNIAIDGSGNVWTFNNVSGSYTVTMMSFTGAVLSGSTGYVAGGDATTPPGALAIDQSGNAWLTGSSHIYKISSTGSIATFVPDEGSSYGKVAIDASGNAWINSTSSTGSLVELSPNGTDLHFTSASPIGNSGIAIDGSGIIWTAGLTNSLYGTPIATGTNINVTESDLSNPSLVAIDAAGNPWVLSNLVSGTTYFLTQFTYNSSTQIYSPASYITSDLRPGGIAIDGAGTVWTAPNYPTPQISGYANTGSGIYSVATYGTNSYSALGLALDPSGNIWTANDASITEYIGASIPVVTPLSAGVANNTLATRP